MAISSNDVDYVFEDGPQYMKQHAKDIGYPFPYLYDETQEVAQSYHAACTPDLYVFGADHLSVYHGRLDGSSPGNSAPVTGENIREVLDCLVNDEVF